MADYLQELYDFLQTMDEEYLVGISNKGIVKRAQKEMPQLTMQMEEMEGGVKIMCEDITCTYRLPLERFTCSCPSRSMCKHRISGILYLKENWKREASKPNDENRFDEIRSYPMNKLQKVLGSRQYTEFLYRWDQGERPIVEKSSLIRVHIPYMNAIVKLVEPLESSTCSCHKKELCIHKALAILAVQLELNVITLEDLKKAYTEEKTEKFEEMKSTAVQICEEVQQCMQVGFSRISQRGTDVWNQLALLAHNSELPAFERELRGLGEELRLSGERNSSFDLIKCMRRMAMVYHKASQMQKEDESRKIMALAGEFQSVYRERADLRLFCTGVKEFQTKSGYEGIRAYFFSVNEGEWYTFTRALPMFYEGKGRKRILSKEQAPWGLTMTMENLVGKELILHQPKVNKENNLSSSSGTQAEVMGEKSLLDYTYPDAFIDFAEIVHNLQKGRRWAFVQAAAAQSVPYDTIRQRYQRILKDQAGRRIMLEMSYEEKNKRSIEILETIDKKEMLPIYFGEVYLSEGQVKMEPIEIFYGTLAAENKTGAQRGYQQEELQILQDLCEELKGYLTMLVQSGYNSSNQSMCAGLLKLAQEYSQCGMNYGSQLICALAMDLETQYGKLKKSWSVVMADFTACVRYQENMAKKLEWEQVKCNQKEVSG